MGSLFPIVNLRSFFYFSSGFIDFAFLMYLLNWIIKLFRHDDK